MHLQKNLLLTTAIFITGIMISCVDIGYNPLDIRKEGVFQQAITPEMSYRFLKTAFSENKPEVFYYLLSNRVRKKIPYWRISFEWDDIRKRLGEDFQSSTLIDFEYIEDSPFETTVAARIVLEYPHPQDGFIIENFLLLLEISDEYQETTPCWRLYFPYKEYQDNAMWFTLLVGEIVKETDKINEVAENSLLSPGEENKK